MRGVVVLFLLLAACSTSPRGANDAAASDAADLGSRPDAASGCACQPGPHERLIYLISDSGEIHTYDPATQQYAFVAGPVCAGAQPFSLAVDGAGLAWINIAEGLSIMQLDLLNPGACSPSPYVRTNADFGLFGMSFATRSATDTCADLYVMTYSGMGAFREGVDLGRLGVINPDGGALSELALVDFDGGELTGTGDGRLFAFAGEAPVKLVEYDRNTGAWLRTLPLDGVQKTNASAAAFFGGDIYLFTEALPAACESCLVDECGAALTDCNEDTVCAEHLQCALTQARFTDDCGGGLSAEMMDCVPRCEACLTPSRARVSRVFRYDLDGSDGGGIEALGGRAPIRVVGAASSPCVPVGPM